MLKNTRLQAVVLVAIGALLGYAAAQVAVHPAFRRLRHAGTALLARRLGDEGTAGRGEKTAISLDTAPETLIAVLDEFQEFLFQRAVGFRDSRTVTVNSWGEFVEAVETGWALALHCGQQSCEDVIKAETGASARVIPSEAPAESGTCVRCDAPSAYGKRVLFGRAY